ncbi:hypothetical protein [Streptomyces clavuligerus]|uniref:Uncharacterized protein n=1 Tax=Streptomyces clavuligerus TaxID=1901 RepID=B5GNX6_STRCL|nr:hypothetical protein [Streptomyces clavuligerus]ANW18953.1 hypothetical protein BB341_12280 [Streptomyces clavuligerus]AXU13531.1 hypothetical protein D1794_12725 [Streptomyces clavuligerus]EDY48022.1 hypothetical protein SSCG_01050 [Streptomyces clavuligerus]EFG08335.1 Hypothetical protein SCLAV_3264 [Streptomyces clavuligerus]MBY6303492.1 hypothetical protein [Streptomyces clavuligerus]
MRPQRFQAYVIGLAGQDPSVSRAGTAAEEGEDGPPCGLVVTAPAGNSRWGIVGQLPDGAKHDGFTDEPVHGTPFTAAPTPGDGPEAWLAGLLAGAACPEIERVERWSVREDARADHTGVTVRFHNGARVFVRLLRP